MDASRVRTRMEDLFQTTPIIVKQPKRFLVDESEYHCYTAYGYYLAHVHEVGLNDGMKALRFVAGNTTGFARRLMVNDAHRRPRLYIEKSWTVLTASTTIAWPNGTPIGYINQDFKLFKAGFQLLDAWKRPIGALKGVDIWQRNFQICDGNDHEIAKIDREVPDVGELFTAADSYVLRQRYPALPEPLKTLVVASGIALDLVLREGKS